MALVFLRAIAPFRRFARGGFQLLDFFAERFVPGGFGFVFAVQARFKRVVISLHDVGVRLVQADQKSIFPLMTIHQPYSLASNPV